MTNPTPCPGTHCLAPDCFRDRQPNLAYCDQHGEDARVYWTDLGRFTGLHGQSRTPLCPDQHAQTQYARGVQSARGLPLCQGGIQGYRWVLSPHASYSNTYALAPLFADGRLGEPLSTGTFYALVLPELNDAATRERHWDRLLAALNAAEAGTGPRHDWRKAPVSGNRWDCARCGAILINTPSQSTAAADCITDRQAFDREAADWLAPAPESPHG